MAEFIRGTGNGLTPLQHSYEIFKQYILTYYFAQLTGKRGSGKPIIIDDSLFRGKGCGDVGRYHFIPQYAGDDAIEGQNASITGNEKTLEEFHMDLRVDQVAQAFAKKGKMTELRTIWDYRSEAKSQLAEWFRNRTERDMVDALSGFITDGVERLSGDAALTTPVVHGEGRCIRPDYASSKFSAVPVAAADTSTSSLLSALTATDVMNTQILDVLQDFAKTAGKYPMKPLRAQNGEEYYMLVLHPKAAISLRNDERWEKRALAAMTGKGSLEGDPIATGALGVWEHIIIKEANFIKTHKNANGTLRIARNLLLGADAAVLAYSQTLDYTEELRDYKRVMGVAADEIRGMRKLIFDDNDLNVAQLPCAIAL